jgi:hypothetical protein
MTLKFETWLSDQQARDDEIGALARTPRIQAYEAKPSKRSNDEHREWADIVIAIADRQNVPVFNEAWREFVAAREAADDTRD